MRRRTIIGFASTLALMAGMAGCSSAVPGGGSDSGTTIEIHSNFTSDVARGKVLDELIAEFNEQHAGEYTVVSKGQPDWPTLQQQIRSKISAGDAPDVFLYNYNPTDLSREESGQLLDWTAALADDSAWKARFKADQLDALTVGGEIVGIPGDQSPALFYYNETMLEQAGIDEFPSTWEELFTVAQTLKESGVGAISMMTADDAWHTMNVFSYLATAAGGADVYAPGADLDSPAISTAADYTKRLLALSTADAVGGNYASSSSSFINGQSAMIVDGPWLISSIQSGVEDPCSIKVAPAPTFDNGEIESGYTVTDSLNAWAAAKQDDPAKEEAVVEWMKFFTSNESAVRMAIDGEYPMAVQTDLSAEDSERASCQVAQVLEINNAAPTVIAQMGRLITPAAQSELPSMLEGLALDRLSPEQFAADLQAANAE
ncbi:extracellular solute-binding protein [Microbacterium oryzae]|uniref:ABC transporter substrate-binding protein n=1 Tax=Microbacterium oryzae TaxID=743009 RepID=UPI0025B08EA0|nr:extracellular solute-binding protein [Microbacterium oryzae]MDN3310464.1 extracellular solute-binding protein [Microbacterium oryzae]